MKKLIVSVLLLLTIVASQTFASGNIESLCKKLIDGSKKTTVEKLAIQVCDVAIKTAKENSTLHKQVSILRSASRKVSKEEAKWSDTKISLADVKKIVADSVII
jgi:hypothetical protein